MPAGSSIAVVTDSTAQPPARGGRASAGSRWCRCRWSSAPRRTTRAPRRRRRAGGRGAAEFAAGEHVAAGAGACSLDVYERGRAGGRRADRLGAPLGRDERDVRVGAARGRGTPPVPVVVRRQPAGRRRRPGTPRWPPPTRSATGGSVEDAAEAAAAPGRGVLVAVLRRHAGVPAARRPDRRRGGAVRRRAGGEAAAADRGRQGRPLEKVRTSGQGARPARGARGRRRPGTARSTSASPTWPTRSGPTSSPTAWPSGSPTTSAGVRCGAASSAPYSVRTWGRPLHHRHPPRRVARTSRAWP